MSRVERVRVSNLRIDPQYQRGRKERLIAEMGRHWDDDLAEAITVSDREGSRNGSMYVIEGQQRVHGARAARVEWLWAKVLDGKTPAEESEKFEGINSSRIRVSYMERFRPRYFRGEPVAALVGEIVHSAGLEIDTEGKSGGNKSPSLLTAIATVERLVRLDPDIARATLTVVLEAWPDDSDRLHTRILQAIGGFIYVYRAHPSYSHHELARALSRKTPMSIIASVRVLTKALSSYVGNERTTPADRAVVVKIYNHGRRGRALPEVTAGDLKRLSLGQNPWSDR